MSEDIYFFLEMENKKQTGYWRVGWLQLYSQQCDSMDSSSWISIILTQMLLFLHSFRPRQSKPPNNGSRKTTGDTDMSTNTLGTSLWGSSSNKGNLLNTSNTVFIYCAAGAMSLFRGFFNPNMYFTYTHDGINTNFGCKRILYLD